jgi:hypothetical protein
MANYMARVELHQAGPEDYERLHGSMQQRGYVREMPGEDGAIYQLPTGTYFVTNTSAMLHVALNAAVSRIGARLDGLGWRRVSLKLEGNKPVIFKREVCPQSASD